MLLHLSNHHRVSFEKVTMIIEYLGSKRQFLGYHKGMLGGNRVYNPPLVLRLPDKGNAGFLSQDRDV